MKITLNLNLELTIDSLTVEGIQSTHNHVCNNDGREHNDADSIESISGSANLKGGMDLTFDMSEEEMKGSYQMIQELGRTFSSRGQRVVEAAEKFTEKLNSSKEEDKQPAAAIEVESMLIAKGKGFKELLSKYNSRPSKAAFEKANTFGRRLEGDIESYLNKTDSPLREIEDLYEEVCTKRREMRQAEAARS